ncbi:MAG: ComEC/Rec2 family competence protein [Candidatus Gracilibacteria bacterium]
MKDQIQISYRQRLIALLLSFLCGEALLFVFPPISVSIFILTLVSLLLLYFRRLLFYSLLICLIFFALGGLRTYHTLESNQKLSITAHQMIYEAEKLKSISGTIISLPIYDGTQYTFTLSSRKDEHPPFIQVKTMTSKKLRIGDKVSLKGKLEFPKNSDGSTFDYINYLKKDGIFLIMNRASLLSTIPRSHLSFTQQISEYNQYLQGKIKNLWHGDVGALIAGILIGSRESMSEDLKNAFQRTGLSHIVAISGSNITIIIIFIFSILGFLSKTIRISTAVLLIILFTILVGGSSAVIRASIMGITGLFALLFERKTTALISLLLSAVIMCAINPMTLLYDIGFALSFLAVLGLLYGEVFFKKPLSYVPEIFAIRESLLMTLSAQIFTTPIMLYYFQSFSIIAPIANLFITPWIPLLMLVSFITLVLSYIPFAGPFVFLGAEAANLLTKFLITLTHLFASIPYASVTIDFLQSIWMCVLIYILLGVLIWYLRTRHFKDNTDSVKK